MQLGPSKNLVSESLKLGSNSYNLQRYFPRNPDNKRELERMRGTHLRYYYD